MRRSAILLVALALGAWACSRKTEPLNPEAADQLRPAAEWLEHESVRLLRDYVRIDTSEKKGEEEGARFLERFFACDGIETEIVCPASRRCNLLARLPGKSREGALLLLNHIDVAPAFEPFWKEAPPFEGVIKGGFLYGRGAYDMKSLAIAQAFAMRNLKRLGVVPRSDILFLGEADEELGQRWGARWLLEHRSDWFSGVRAVLNEGGTNEMILRGVRFWGVETLQAGYAIGVFESSSPAMLEALARKWRKLNSPVVSPHPQVALAFDMLANHLGSPLTDPLRHLERVRRNPAELAILPDRYGSFLEARIQWSSPYASPPGGQGNFQCFVSISTPPGMDPGPYLSPILSDARRSKIQVTTSFSGGPSTASPYPTPLSDLLLRLTEARHPGVPFGPVPTFGGYTTSALFRQKGFATYGYSPIPINITDAARRHGSDERIFLRDYLNGVELYEDVLEEFAYVPRADSH